MRDNAPPSKAPDTELLARLQQISQKQGLMNLSEALSALTEFIGEDLIHIESDLSQLPSHGDKVSKSAHHLLRLKGKRLRPLCVALAARCGEGFDAAGRELASAVELVHNATLLHDDVIDVGLMRRGEPTARVVYGNAASVYAGDWLLIEALLRVRRSGLDAALDQLLHTIDAMIWGEAVQLENRGRVVSDIEVYYQVIRGKTAALFRWGLWAGAISGHLEASAADALGRYGEELGLAFQLVDDALDFSGDAARTGKALFTDLREGKLTYPLILALDRVPALRTEVLAFLEAGEDGHEEARSERILQAMTASGAIEDTLKRAEAHSETAVQALSAVPLSEAREALAIVAKSSVRREL